MAEKMTLKMVRDEMRMIQGNVRVTCTKENVGEWADAIDAHLAQPAQAVDVGLVERLRKRAAEERKIAENNVRVAELLAPELVRFEAREGHNIYATRMAIDHRDSAKRDAAFADDLEAAATALTRAIGNAQAEVDPLVIRLGEVTTRLEDAMAEIKRLNAAWAARSHDAVMAESRLAAANALLRECVHFIDYGGAADDDLAERIEAHLSENGHD